MSNQMHETSHGFGRMLVAIYGVFAIAATARSSYQLATKFGDAPTAYVLSAVAALVYILATWALATNRHRLAVVTIGFELAGVLVVGVLTIVDADLFPDASVWSGFGQGYGYVPLLLPIIGLAWLRTTSQKT